MYSAVRWAESALKLQETSFQCWRARQAHLDTKEGNGKVKAYPEGNLCLNVDSGCGCAYQRVLGEFYMEWEPGVGVCTQITCLTQVLALQISFPQLHHYLTPVRILVIHTLWLMTHELMLDLSATHYLCSLGSVSRDWVCISVTPLLNWNHDSGTASVAES